MNESNDRSKNEAMNEYLSKRRKKDYKSGFIRSIFQVLAANGVAGMFLYHICTSEIIGTQIFVTIICTLFAIGIDWVFITTYIKK